MKRIAENFDEFIVKVEEAERTVLNTEIGQQFTKEYLKECLRKNPEMTAEEWTEKKSELMTVIFLMFVKENPEAFKEFAEHTYNELRKEEN